jgi:pimeloyl-ACP methyl ester carboxylesterase
MGFIVNHYIKYFVHRYDKEVGIPYYSYKDFKDFKCEDNSFTNSYGINLRYFFYYYANYKKDKIILFCHGMGPGHTAYIAEIESLARRGYKVLTLDFAGCGESGGKYLGSLNKPTRDVVDLLNHLNLKEQIILMGHSMGGYTALNTLCLRKDITKVVAISPIIQIEPLLQLNTKSKFITKHLLRYERKVNREIFDINIPKYLENTTDDVFVIQSKDDQMVPYGMSLKVIEGIKNPHIKTKRYEGRKHNPNYTDNAISYMDSVFGKYYALLNEKKIKTDEDRINYFKDVSLAKLVEQDEQLFDEIVDFIEK